MDHKKNPTFSIRRKHLSFDGWIVLYRRYVIDVMGNGWFRRLMVNHLIVDQANASSNLVGTAD